MTWKTMSDVPNKTVRLFLQEAGKQYDANRGYRPFKKDAEILDRFRNRCAYCGEEAIRLVDEHVLGINRQWAGLHAWGNIVPSCSPCNVSKANKEWRTTTTLNDKRREAIEDYIRDYRYAPDVDELKVVLGKLYELSDKQNRSLPSGVDPVRA